MDMNEKSTNHASFNIGNGRKMKDVEEIKISMPWGHVSGKWWGSKDVQPILALHGWQDNAGSFDSLAELLSDKIAILSIDLPGHGFSAHLPYGQFYYIFWDGVILLRRIVNHYKWNKDLPTGKWWGSKKIQPIVALHGRQDNAGSFDMLIPLLPDDISVLCLDMPGHGLSSHYPKSQFYYVYWDGVILLRKIIKHFNWNKVKLLGHSLGGAIGFLYAAAYPDEVDFFISLDIVCPSVKHTLKLAPATGDHIDKFLKFDLLTLDSAPCYEYDEMLKIVENAYEGSITKEAAEILMKRGIQPAYKKDKYLFSRDPKLKISFLGMLSLDLVLQYASQIKCAYLNIRALSGHSDQVEIYPKILETIKLGAKRFEYHEVEGTHHVHLNEPEKVAPIINNFLRN